MSIPEITPRRPDGSFFNSYAAPKKPDSITISLEFLRGVEAAADTPLATDLLTEDERITLAEEALVSEAARLRKEATK